MTKEAQKKLKKALMIIRKPASVDSRTLLEAWAFLDAWRTHYPSSYPKNAPSKPDLSTLDPNRFIKNRRLAIAWLADQDE